MVGVHYFFFAIGKLIDYRSLDNKRIDSMHDIGPGLTEVT